MGQLVGALLVALVVAAKGVVMEEVAAGAEAGAAGAAMVEGETEETVAAASTAGQMGTELGRGHFARGWRSRPQHRLGQIRRQGMKTQRMQ